MNLSASTSNLQNNLFKSINIIKPFQNNKFRLLKNNVGNNNIYKDNTLNSFTRLTETNSNSRIKFKEQYNLNNNFDNASNNTLKIQKKNQIYNKYRINVNPQINNPNYILSTDNNNYYNNKNIKSYFLNRKISNNIKLSKKTNFKKILTRNDNKMSLSQKNQSIKFLKIYEKNLRAISKNIAYTFKND